VLDGDLSALAKLRERLPEVAAGASDLLAMEGEGSPFLNNLRSALLPVIPEVAPVIDELVTITDVLTGMGLRPRVAPALVRDFEYYTGPVFHLFVEGSKVAGGGRYDALISQVGHESVPASGFAVEMEALWPLLPQREPPMDGAARVRSDQRNGGDLTAAFSLARALREAGVTVSLTAETAGESGTEITASSNGYLSADGEGGSTSPGAVNQVVRAVADAAQD
jgi:histidyl-tRNA synthetase